MDGTLRFIRNAGLLFLFWLLLSGRYEPAYLAMGLIASVVVAGLHARQPGPPNPTIPLIRFLLYLPWLFYQILLSNLHTSYLILHPRLPIAPRFLRYQTRLQDPAAVALLAQSITLTPGTVTVEVAEGELVIHSLDEASAEDLTGGRLEREIAWVFKKKGS